MKQIIFILVICLGMISCDKNEIISTTSNSVNEQTVFMYLPWSTDLTSYFYTNISDLESAIAKNILKNERVIVFLSTTPTEATLFEIKYEQGKSVRQTLKNYSDPAFTTANGITSFLNDVVAFAPAERYAMIIGCHGTGWLNTSTTRSSDLETMFHWGNEEANVQLTRAFGGKTSEYQTDITTLAEGISNAGIKMEYILFDDCYMSSIETAYDLKDVTDYLIASPCEIMACGLPYAEIAPYLFGNVNYEKISNIFIDFYENYSMPCGTIAITVCSELDNLAKIMKEINNKYQFDTTQLNELQRMDGYSPTIFYDYGDYVSKLCTDKELLAKFEDQFERTVPSKYKKCTDFFYAMSRGKLEINTYSGITISDPSTNTLTSSKVETAWYDATH